MVKVKKILSVILSTLLLLSVFFIVAGCKKKYDVGFKLYYVEVQDGKRVLPVLGELIFDKDTDELYIEREYDGKEYEYFIAQYENPTYNPRHSSTKSLWSNTVGDLYFSLTKEGEQLEDLRETVCERGNYCYTYYIVHGANLPENYSSINPRILRLYISII